eukprot:Gb_32132 [translate_table: standard]
MGRFAVQVEPGHEGKDGKPSVGPVYRNILSKDGFPTPAPGMNTMWDIFSNSVKRNPTNQMLGIREIVNGKAGKYVWQTYGEVYELVINIGAAMRACGVQPGSRCGIYGVNCPEWIIALKACEGHAITCVPLYDTLGANAVDFIVKHAELGIVFIQDAKLPELFKPMLTCVGQIKTLVCFTNFTSEQQEEAATLGITAYSWHEFLELGKKHPTDLSPPSPLDICTIMYTSGTSGEPKGVILTHETLTVQIVGVDLFLDKIEDKMTTQDIYFSFLPLAHILDRVLEEYFIHRGASVGYWQGDPKLLAEDILELKPSLFAGVPRVFDRVYAGGIKTLKESSLLKRLMFNVLYNYKLAWMKLGFSHSAASPLADKIIFSKIKAKLGGRVRLLMSGAAPLSSHVEEFLRVTTCAYVLQGYGLTETCGWTSVCLPDEWSLLGTVGSPAPSLEVRLEAVPEMGYDPLADVSRGEICCRGKTVFSGYYKRYDLDKEAFQDGWFHTGDIGEMLPNGVLKIIDRKKNIFKLSQGEYVAVEHLENVYSQCSCIDGIWIYGNSFEPFLVAVVVPNQQQAEIWAEVKGEKGDFNELCLHPALKTFILEELTSVAKKNNLRGFEVVKAIHLDPWPFDIERDLVTPTFKKRRPQLLTYYQKEIQKMYEDLKKGAVGSIH